MHKRDGTMSAGEGITNSNKIINQTAEANK